MLNCAGASLEQLRRALPSARRLGQAGDLPLAGLASDSREVTEGVVFFALPGARVDGADFIDSAFEAGAPLVVAQKEVRVPEGRELLVVEDARQAMADAAVALSRELLSRLTLVGVTGTNGKTTTSHMLRAILERAGYEAAAIGTTGITGPGGEVTRTKNTTPDILTLLETFAELDAAGCRHVVLEVSSQGVVQRRVAGLPFRVGVFTNLSPEHSETHGSYDEYRRAKLRFFEDAGRDALAFGRAFVGVVSGDDPESERFASACPGPPFTYGFSLSCDVRASEIELGVDGARFFLSAPSCSCNKWVDIPLTGRHNVLNALAAASAAFALGMSPVTVCEGLAAMGVVPGRLERVLPPGAGDAAGDAAGGRDRASTGGGAELPVVFVDYAHTSDGLSRLLETCRELSDGRGGKLAVVFGCGGDRDREKRPRMGNIASSCADRCYITSDNPRSEDPMDIIEEILSGIDGESRSSVIVDPDRRRAIERAIVEAGPPDVVVIAGKGHEDYQIVGDTVLDFDDRLVASEVLARLADGGRRDRLSAVAPRSAASGGSPGDPLYLDCAELAAVTGAETPFGFTGLAPSGVRIDSREVQPGDVFFGLAGETTHGQRFAAQALDRGAAAVVVEDAEEAGCLDRAGVLVVPSALEALQKAAAVVRSKIRAPVVAVTGTNGKTTTKDVVSSVLSSYLGAVHSTRGNYNNHIGLPLCLLSTPRSAAACVFELGMSAPGEIDFLASILEPTTGIITNVGAAHLDTLGTIEAVAEAKAELVGHLDDKDLLLLNADCHWHDFIAGKRRGRTAFVGVSRKLSRLLAAELLRPRVSFDRVEGELLLDGRSAGMVRLPIAGLHVASAFLFAAAVTVELGLGPEGLAEALASCKPAWGRMQTLTVGPFTVVNDAYNANPDSMRNALRHVAATDTGCLVALGEMLELGEVSSSAHAAVARLACRLLGAERVFLLGKAYLEAKERMDGLKVFTGIDELAGALFDALEPGGRLLIKASRGAAIERVIPALERMAGAERRGDGTRGDSGHA